MKIHLDFASFERYFKANTLSSIETFAMKNLINSFIILLIFLINVLSAALLDEEYVDDLEIYDIG